MLLMYLINVHVSDNEPHVMNVKDKMTYLCFKSNRLLPKYFVILSILMIPIKL